MYGVVVDECQNGVFDTGEDSFVDEAFRVVVQDDVPPLSPEAAQFQALTVQAARLDTGMSQIEQLLRLKAIRDRCVQLLRPERCSVGQQFVTVERDR